MSKAFGVQLEECLRQLHLPSFRSNFSAHAALAANEGWPYDRYLLELCELEVEERQQRRIQRLLQNSKLPRDKTLTSFDRSRLPDSVDRQLSYLVEGDFLERRENVLVFGNPDPLT